MILDEIDQLEQLLLYKLFEMALMPTSSLILLGISNSLDLVDRTLPRLRAKQLEPELLHFIPYKVEAIMTIIGNRLSSIDLTRYEAQPGLTSSSQVFEVHALRLCAMKLVDTGDIRKVLDTCCRALDVAVSLPVKVPDVVKLFGKQSGMASEATKITELTIQAKLVLCAMLSSKGKDNSVTKVSRPQEFWLCDRSKSLSLLLFQLFETYRTLVKGVYPTVSKTDFLDILGTLEAPGLVTQTEKKKDKEWKVLVASDAICSALKDTPIVADLLPKKTQSS